MINRKLIVHIAKLARLELTEGEIDLYEKQLTKILEYIEQLKELDVKDVEPFTHPGESKNVMRDDRHGEQLKKEEALRNAPDRQGDFFSVPKILE